MEEYFTCCGYSQLPPSLSQEGERRPLAPAQDHLHPLDGRSSTLHIRCIQDDDAHGDVDNDSDDSFLIPQLLQAEGAILPVQCIG